MTKVNGPATNQERALKKEPLKHFDFTLPEARQILFNFLRKMPL